MLAVETTVECAKRRHKGGHTHSVELCNASDAIAVVSQPSFFTLQVLRLWARLQAPSPLLHGWN